MEIGCGIMGEQGAESIHAHINHLERTYQSIPNELDRLKYIFQEQALESDPLLTALSLLYNSICYVPCLLYFVFVLPLSLLKTVPYRERHNFCKKNLYPHKT